MFLASRRELIFNETSCTILDNLFRDLVGSLPLSLSLSLSLFSLPSSGRNGNDAFPLKELFVVLEQGNRRDVSSCDTRVYTHEYRS